MKELLEYGAQALKLGRLDDAARVFAEILEQHPNDFNTLHLSGLVEARRGNNEAAADYMTRAISVVPTHASTYSNLAIVLLRLGRLQEALQRSDQGLAINPDMAGAHNNRGLILHNLGRSEEALLAYQQASNVEPNNAAAQLNEGIIQMLLGNYARGWQLYERRWETASFVPDRKKAPFPIWLGEESVSGKTIFVNSEQGFGDVIQFSRYIPLLMERGVKVIFGVKPPLYDLMRSTFPDCTILTAGDDLPDFDLYTSLMSLPGAFGTTLDNIPPPTEVVCKPKFKLDGLRPAIGLVWSGSSVDHSAGDGLNRYRDALRSMSFEQVASLLGFPATWVSLQKDVREADHSLIKAAGSLLLQPQLDDFAHTAAIIETLDLVISADTAVAHLAASMGKPTWIMIPYVPCWRWMLKRTDSPWYPTARLFRQDERQAWDTVIQDIKEALHGCCDEDVGAGSRLRLRVGAGRASVVDRARQRQTA